MSFDLTFRDRGLLGQFVADMLRQSGHHHDRLPAVRRAGAQPQEQGSVVLRIRRADPPHQIGANESDIFPQSSEAAER